MRFKKPIVTTGIYTIPGDSPRKVEITNDRLSHWASQFSAMKDAGVSVPAPWNHSKEALPMSVGNDGTLPRSDINAGWWDKIWVEDNTLWGELDVPRSEDAVKIGTNVKETSIYVRPEFSDGSGNSWDDSLMHIALVTHPIENGQGNFEPVTNEEEAGIALAMSQLTEPLSMSSIDNDHQVGSVKTKSGIQEMLEALRAVMIDLPDDTHEVNFMERLLVALRQKKASENPEDSSISNPPEGAKEQPAPVAMSQEKENLEQGAGVASNEEAVLSHPTYKAASKTIEFLMSHLNGQEKDKLSSRRDALVKSGKISEDYASKHLDPAINEFQMSFGDDGSVKVCPASTIMEALEASPSLTTGIISGSDSDQASLQQIGLAMSQSGTTGLPQGYQEEGNPNEVGGPSAEEIALEFLSNTGHAG
tara:strand:+ start:8290 stop:9546 length:1257 start_codon:yes stop_codon:yes gene_type:complete